MSVTIRGNKTRARFRLVVLDSSPNKGQPKTASASFDADDADAASIKDMALDCAVKGEYRQFQKKERVK